MRFVTEDIPSKYLKNKTMYGGASTAVFLLEELVLACFKLVYEPVHFLL